MDLVAWANAIPQEVLTGVELTIVGGLALMAMYVVWPRPKSKDQDGDASNEGAGSEPEPPPQT